jgi:hypothetical protein
MKNEDLKNDFRQVVYDCLELIGYIVACAVILFVAYVLYGNN